MTTPTQAQIEALTDNLRFLATKKDGDPNISRVPSSTLIEAANTIAALTAVAGVGEQDWQRGFEAGMKSAAPAIDVLKTDNQRIEAATIERCAQVAEKYEAVYGFLVPREIAAAIRALKEKA